MIAAPVVAGGKTALIGIGARTPVAHQATTQHPDRPCCERSPGGVPWLTAGRRQQASRRPSTQTVKSEHGPATPADPSG